MKDFLERLYMTASPVLIRIPYVPIERRVKEKWWRPATKVVDYKHPFDLSVADMKFRLGLNNDMSDLRMALNNMLVAIHRHIPGNDGQSETLELKLTDRGLTYIGR
jgi:hypothetical protein